MDVPIWLFHFKFADYLLRGAHLSSEMVFRSACFGLPSYVHLRLVSVSSPGLVWDY